MCVYKLNIWVTETFFVKLLTFKSEKNNIYMSANNVYVIYRIRLLYV